MVVVGLHHHTNPVLCIPEQHWRHRRRTPELRYGPLHPVLRPGGNSLNLARQARGQGCSER